MQSNHVDEQKGDCIYSYGPIATLPTIIYYHPMTTGRILDRSIASGCLDSSAITTTSGAGAMGWRI